MRGEIIAIGNELTSGRIVNTTSGFAARHLFEEGYEIYAMHTIGDTPKLIGEALKRAIARVDFVIVTGGLGSTDDDLTNEAVSQALNRPTSPNLEILSIIGSHLDATSTSPVCALEKLAWLPKGADPLDPNARMAGYSLIHNHKPIFFLPGIPNQMEKLMVDHVLPQLASLHKDRQFSTHSRLFKIFGLNELQVNQLIEPIQFGDSIQIGYYEVHPEVHLSLMTRDTPDNSPDKLLDLASRSVKKTLGDAIYGFNLDTMESVVGSLLKEAGLTLAVAESCTGGLLSSKITRVGGSSAYFTGGVTSYANSMKETILHVPKIVLEEYGAVSDQVARAMAQGIRQQSGADITISITGIAGPEGGSNDKPVGTVFICFAAENVLNSHQFQFYGNRLQIQEMAAQTGLDLIRRYLLHNRNVSE